MARDLFASAGISPYSAEDHINYIIDNFEGTGYVPDDAGRGASKFGINASANPDLDIKNLTRDQAVARYKQNYWDAIDGDNLSPDIQRLALDTAINFGPGTAKKWLEESGGDPSLFLDLRMNKRQQLLKADPERFGKYAYAWQKRDNAFVPAPEGDIQLGGSANDNITEQSTTPRDLFAEAGIAIQPKEPSAWDEYGQPFVDTLKQGLSDAKDFATLNYADTTPAMEALREKKRTGQPVDRHDYERVFLEGMHNSPPGKALSAVTGVIPEFNVVATALGKWINPAISKATGIDEAELQLLEMAAPAVVKGVNVARGKAAPSGPAPTLPSIKAAKAVINSPQSKRILADESSFVPPVGKIVTDTTAATVKAAQAAARPIADPIVRGIIDSDNPITGEPGLKTALASDTAKEGARLGKKLGIDFSAGELTGNATAMGIEDALANSGRYSGRFAEAHQAKTDTLVKRYTEALDKIYPQGSSRTDVGNRISTAYNSTINSLVEARAAQAQKDAAAAGIATRGERVINTDNFQQVLIDFIDEGNSPLATPAQKSAAAQAKPILKKLTDNPLISVRDLQSGLASFGDGAKASGGIWKNLATASDKRFARSTKEALLQDMDASIQGGESGAAALKTFRDNYRQNSNKIADLQQTTLGKIVGASERDSSGNLIVSPEKIADRFTSMQPTELKNTLDFLDKNHPDVANIGRRYMLQRALDKAVGGRGLRGVGTTKKFAKAEFVKSLPSEETLNIMFKDPRAGKDILDIAAATNRLIDWGAVQKGSQTAQRTDFLQKIASWGKGHLLRSIVSDSLAQDLLNPTKRAAIAKEIRENTK